MHSQVRPGRSICHWGKVWPVSVCGAGECLSEWAGRLRVVTMMQHLQTHLPTTPAASAAAGAVGALAVGGLLSRCAARPPTPPPTPSGGAVAAAPAPARLVAGAPAPVAPGASLAPTPSRMRQMHITNTQEGGLANSSVLVIGVCGGSGSGKSTVSEKLVAGIGAHQLAYLAHDWYYRDQSHVTDMAVRAANNYDHPDSLETELMVEHVKELKRMIDIKVPQYDFARHTRFGGPGWAQSDAPGDFKLVTAAPIVLLEGILLFEHVRPCLPTPRVPILSSPNPRPCPGWLAGGAARPDRHPCVCRRGRGPPFHPSDDPRRRGARADCGGHRDAVHGDGSPDAHPVRGADEGPRPHRAAGERAERDGGRAAADLRAAARRRGHADLCGPPPPPSALLPFSLVPLLSPKAGCWPTDTARVKADRVRWEKSAAAELTTQQTLQVVAAFRATDLDGNGQLTLSELKKWLQAYSTQTPNEVPDAAYAAHRSVPAFLVSDALPAGGINRAGGPRGPAFKRVFDAFDADGNQQLSLDEFKRLCGALKAAAAEGPDGENAFESFLQALGRSGGFHSAFAPEFKQVD